MTTMMFMKSYPKSWLGFWTCPLARILENGHFAHLLTLLMEKNASPIHCMKKQRRSALSRLPLPSRSGRLSQRRYAQNSQLCIEKEKEGTINTHKAAVGRCRHERPKKQLSAGTRLRERWVLLKIPRGDINGVGEVK